MVMSIIHQIVEQKQSVILDHLFELLRIPTISSEPKNIGNLEQAAQWLVEYCQKIGLETQLFITSGAPVVLAEYCPYPDKPILLIYGHYDVQPIDPLDDWLTSPFSPTINDDLIYARGASDDKGQIFSVLAAIDIILNQNKSLPCNVKIVIEGEEEIGSVHFEKLLKTHLDLFRSDSLLVMDTMQYSRGIPALTYGLRGLVYFQITCCSAAHDLHSGQFGGELAPNPCFSLIKILSEFKNDRGQVTIPGFYQNVREPETWEREEMSKLPFHKETLKGELNIKDIQHEIYYSPFESMTVRPTFDICGIWGGYLGSGSKTIIPARCQAKFSFRLVPDQTPEEVISLLEDHLKTIVPQYIDYKIDVLSTFEPLLSDPRQPIFSALSSAIEKNFNRSPVLIRSGLSVGAVNLFKKIFQINSICMTGWGNPSDKVHSPNEHLSITDFFRGIHSIIDFLFEYQDPSGV